MANDDFVVAANVTVVAAASDAVFVAFAIATGDSRFYITAVIVVAVVTSAVTVAVIAPTCATHMTPFPNPKMADAE